MSRPAVSACFTPAEVRDRARGSTAIVVDVVRATTCIVEAMANGATAVYPAGSIEEAVALREKLGRDGILLCGERAGLRIDGFDLGNSPAEFAADAVRGKRLAMTTTNGTKALVAARAADRVLVASFLNAAAVADAARDDASIVVVCAGKEGRFSLDDVVCAGRIVRDLAGDGERPAAALDDAARAAADLALANPLSRDMLARTAAGRALVDAGLGSDLDLCAKADTRRIVPAMRDGAISAPSG